MEPPISRMLIAGFAKLCDAIEACVRLPDGGSPGRACGDGVGAVRAMGCAGGDGILRTRRTHGGWQVDSVRI